MRVERFSMKWIITIALLAIAAVFIAGCGGGGGGGGGSSSTGGSTSGGSTSGTGSNTNGIFSGTLTLVNNEGAAVGYTVSFDGNGSYSVRTNANGNFSLKVPSSAITGNDTLNILQPNGTPSFNYLLPVGSTGESGLNITTGPPAPPTASETKHVVKATGV